jgi:hypothetical protein
MAPLSVSGLTQVVLSGNVVPGTDDTYSIGSNGQRMRNIYSTELDVSDEGADAGLY